MQAPRLYCPLPLFTGESVVLHAAATRHTQVLRLQPGNVLTLFNGQGGEFLATVTIMERQGTTVQIGEHRIVEREAVREVHLALGVPTNDRMDAFVEKACELGAMSITPLMTDRSVLRLSGERADKRRAHWQGIAIAACEQSGRNRIPLIHPITALSVWLKTRSSPTIPTTPCAQWILSFDANALSMTRAIPQSKARSIQLLSGPEGGLTPAEERQAVQSGFVPLSLGNRILRADTAPLAAMAILSVLAI